MSEVLDILYGNVMHELVETRRHLLFAEEQNQQLREQYDEIQESESKLKNENLDLKCKMKSLDDQLTYQERAYYQLSVLSNNHQAENHFLKSQNNFLIMQLDEANQEYFKLKEIVESFFRQEVTTALEVHQAPSEQPRTDDKPQATDQSPKSNQTMTIAMKLKLCQDSKSSAAKKEPKSKEPKPNVSGNFRLFVGHLHPATKEEALQEYFKQFGKVSDVYFPKDASGCHRGFAFVTFASLKGEHPLNVTDHVIDGRSVYLDISSYAKGEAKPTKTLLVSGIIQNASNESLQKHFSKYGKVLEVVRHKEKNNLFSRWAFVHFRDFESVDKALADETHQVNGQFVDCRRAYNFNPEGKKRDSHKSKPDPIAAAAVKEPTSPKDSADVTKLLIGNLSNTTTTEMLVAHFSKYATVLDSYIPTVYGTTGSKGFGYIIIPSKDMKLFNQKHVIDGSTVHISKEGKPDKTLKTTTLLVSAGPQIMKNISENDLTKFFSRFGKVLSVRKFTDPGTKKPSHYAFVEYSSSNAVEKALAKLAYKINGKIICITKSRYNPHK